MVTTPDSALESVKQFAFIAFTLLGVLFGMVIMGFIFSQLGTNAIDFDDDTVTVLNVTSFINSSIFTISEFSTEGFNGGFAVVIARNRSNGATITAENYTVSASLGTIINATAQGWDNVSLTYSYLSKSSAELSAEDVQNNSLQAIVTYSDGASTQFNTVSIAIILSLLIAVFLIFWRIFVTNSKGNKSGENLGTFG